MSQFYLTVAALHVLLHTLAVGILLFVPCWKIYETSYAFREAADPSLYDQTKEWFKTASLPLAYIDNEKVLYRLYAFVVSILCVYALWALKAALPRKQGLEVTMQTRWWFPLWRRTLHMPRFLVRLCNFPRSVTVGECVLVSLFLLAQVLTVYARVDRSLVRGARKLEFLKEEPGEEPIDSFSWQALEIWGKTLGVLSIMNIGWYLMLPVGRRSVLLEIMNVSWERGMTYHRWVGYWTMLVIVLHLLFYCFVWGHGNGHENYDPEGQMLRKNLLAWGCNGADTCSLDEKIIHSSNMYGIVAFVALLVMVVSSLDFVRRRFFELFYYLHHLFAIVLIFSYLHYGGATSYLLPGVVLHCVDRFSRVVAGWDAYEVQATMLGEDLLELRVPLAGCTYKTGQYIFVNAPKVSLLQWHPISVSSCHVDSPTSCILYIKALGAWSKGLLDEARQREGTVSLKLDGFYGEDAAEETLKPEQHFMFVAGGVGITAYLSAMVDVLRSGAEQQKKGWVVWATKSTSEFLALAPVLVRAMHAYGDRLQLRVFITRAEEEDLTEAIMARLSDGEAASDAAGVVGYRRRGFGPLTYVALGVTALAVGTWAYAETLLWEAEEETVEQEMKRRFAALWYPFAWVACLVLPLGWLLMNHTPPLLQLLLRACRCTAGGMDTGAEAAPGMPTVGDEEEVASLRAHAAALARSLAFGKRPELAEEVTAVAGSLEKGERVWVKAVGPTHIVQAAQAACPRHWIFDEENWEW